VGGTAFNSGGAFVWRHGRSEVTLAREGDTWHVVYTAIGRLLGPRHVVYSASHKQATHAAWDVMARVIRASRDEDEGLRAGRSAAAWMREFADFDLPEEPQA
jgi:hypothetical protein